MRRGAVALAACGVLGACTAPAPSVAPGPAASAPPPAASVPSPAARTGIALANAGFEDEARAGIRCPPRWGCRSHADPHSHRFVLDEAAPASGRRSLCIERVTKEPWALATQGLHDAGLRGKRLRLSLALRVDGAVDGAGPWILVHRASGNDLHEQNLVKSTGGWQRLAVEVAVPADAQIVEVGAALEGPGRICLDDVKLEVLGQ